MLPMIHKPFHQKTKRITLFLIISIEVTAAKPMTSGGESAKVKTLVYITEH